MTASIALAVAAGCAGGLVGGLAVPRLASVLLGRSYRRARSWWWESLAAYRAFKREHPSREPSARAAGSEGSIGLWRAQALRDAEAGVLPRERLRALIGAGCAQGAPPPARSEAEQEARCAFRAKPRQRCLGALLCAAAGAGIAWVSDGPSTGAALALAAAAMALAVACDLRARIVPLETCAALAAAGLAFQASTAGIGGVLAGCGFSCLVAACCLAVNRLFGRSGRAPVGYGDVRCMAALSLAGGAATPIGAALCYGSAAAFSLAGIAAGKLSWRSGIPMAPFLAVWLAGATLSCLHNMG